MTKIFLVVVFIFIFLGFIIYYSNSPQPNPPNSPQPNPSNPPNPPYIISYPEDLSNNNQIICDRLLQTLYPLFKEDKPSKNLWKTLDFFYGAGDLNSYVLNYNSSIGYPSQNNITPIVKSILSFFRQNVPSNKRSLNDNFNKSSHTSYVSELFDIVSYPFTGSNQINSVDGYFINRFDPNDLFGKNIAFCRTGTHNAEFSIVDKVTNTSAYYIGIRDQTGEILGFKDNVPIEYAHIYTHHSPNNIDEQFFDTMSAGFGDFLYYARGSGLFFNPKKILHARNKIDAARIALHYSKMTPTVSGWNNSITDVRGDENKNKNPYYQKCQNTFQGFLNLVKMWGVDKEIILSDDNKNGTIPSTNYPDFLSNTLKLSCTENGYKYGGNEGFWCPGVPILLQYHCCIKSGGTQCEKGGSESSFLSDDSDECNLTTSFNSYISWRAFINFVPKNLPDNTLLDTDEMKLAWLLYVSCNGIDKISGMFNNPWDETILNPSQIILLTQTVAWLANLGGIGDDIYIVPMKYTALDDKQNRLFDTCIMYGQPEATGCLATEIMTLVFDGTVHPFSTVHPEKGTSKSCKYMINPAFHKNYDKKDIACKSTDDCIDSKGIYGICIGEKNKTCQPPSVLVCDKVSWATPILSYPIWSKDKNYFDITSSCNIGVENRQDCGYGDQDECISNGCCFDDTVDGTQYPWCYYKNF